MAGAELFAQQSKRWEAYEERGGPAVVAAVDSAKLLAESETLSEGERRAAILEVQETVHRLIKLDAVAAARRDVFKRLADAVRRAGPELDVRRLYEEEMKRAEQAAARVRVGQDARARAVGELLQSGGDDDDIEVAVTAGGGSMGAVAKCPILSTPLMMPLRNEACGHIYSAQGTLLLLNQKHGRSYKTLDEVPAGLAAPCPVAGCTHRFNAKSLKRDYAAERSQRLRSATRDDADEEMVDMR